MINDLGVPFTVQHSPKLFLSDQSLHEHLMALQLCGEQPQNLLAYTSYFSPLPSSVIMGQFALPRTALGPHGGLHSPTTTPVTRPGDFQLASIRPEWPQQKSIRGSCSTHSDQVPNSNQYQNQIPQEFVCGYSPDLEPGPHVPSVPAQSPPMLQVSDSHWSAGKPEPWMNHVLGSATGTSLPSSDWDDLSASGFLRSFSDYECLPAAEVGTDPSRIGGSSFRKFVQSLSVPLPCSEPTGGSGRSERTFACRWLANGALCDSHVMLDRRSIVEHLQRAHGIKPGEEKARELCLWEKCRTTLNKESLARHISTVHLKEGARCHDCGVVFAREDSLKRHLKGGLHNAPPEKRGTKQSP